MLPSSVSGQLPGYLHPGITDPLESWLEIREATENGISREIEDNLRIQPVDLNRASAGALVASGLFTPYQAEMIQRFRTRYGPFLSIYELGALEGFRPGYLREISCYLAVFPLEPEPGGAFRLNATFSLGRTFPAPAAYGDRNDGEAEPRYAGSPLRVRQKVKAEKGAGWSAGLAFEKDPGEPAWRDHQPQYTTGYVARDFHGSGLEMIAGTYRLHLGSGLIQGSGYLPRASGSPVSRAGLESLRPYAGWSETGVHRGLGIRWNGRGLHGMAWFSHTPLALSLQGVKGSYSETDWTRHRRTTGLYRTDGETGGRGLAGLLNGGTSLSVHLEQAVIGAQISAETSRLTTRGKDSLRFRDPSGWYWHPGFYFLWNRKSLRAYGEFAPSGKGRSAFRIGAGWKVSEYLRTGIRIHRSDPGFRDTFSGCGYSGSRPVNETGIQITLRAEPHRQVIIHSWVDWFYFPAPRYNAHVPSGGYRIRIHLGNSAKREIHWQVRLCHRETSVNGPAGDSGFRPLRTDKRLRLEGRLQFSPVPSLTVLLRLAGSFTRSRAGSVLVVRTRYSARERAVFTLQCTSFHLPDWEGRLYLYEPGLYQQMRFPVCSGTGHRISATASVRVHRRITAELWGMLHSYRDRDGLGSGYDRIDLPRKVETGIQFRCSF